MQAGRNNLHLTERYQALINQFDSWEFNSLLYIYVKYLDAFKTNTHIIVFCS